MARPREFESSNFQFQRRCLSVGLYFEVPAALGDCSHMQMEVLEAYGEWLAQYLEVGMQ